MHELKHLIDISSPIEAVFPLVSTAEGIAKWWAQDTAMDPATGMVDVGFFNKSTVYRLSAETMTPGKCASWHCETGKEWQGTKLVFELLAADYKTSLHFTHKGWREQTDYFIGCNTVWGALMFRLKAAAEGKRPGPLFSSEGITD